MLLDIEPGLMSPFVHDNEICHKKDLLILSATIEFTTKNVNRFLFNGFHSSVYKHVILNGSGWFYWDQLTHRKFMDERLSKLKDYGIVYVKVASVWNHDWERLRKCQDVRTVAHTAVNLCN